MELNREVGEIRTQVRYMTQEISELRKDVKSLLGFKWQILGFATCAAFVATLIIETVKAAVK